MFGRAYNVCIVIHVIDQFELRKPEPTTTGGATCQRMVNNGIAPIFFQENIHFSDNKIEFACALTLFGSINTLKDCLNDKKCVHM